jgi:hypothetical protein
MTKSTPSTMRCHATYIFVLEKETELEPSGQHCLHPARGSISPSRTGCANLFAPAHAGPSPSRGSSICDAPLSSIHSTLLAVISVALLLHGLLMMHPFSFRGLLRVPFNRPRRRSPRRVHGSHSPKPLEPVAGYLPLLWSHTRRLRSSHRHSVIVIGTRTAHGTSGDLMSRAPHGEGTRLRSLESRSDIEPRSAGESNPAEESRVPAACLYQVARVRNPR